jgi:hypothetical protein
MIKKSKKKLIGGMVRAGSVQHFRRGKAKSILKNKKRKLRGGMVKDGSVQHFRRGKSKSLLKKKRKKSLRRLRLKKH